MKFFTAFLALGFVVSFASTAKAAPTADEIIAQARAKIGTEAALNSVKTLTYEAKVFDASDKQVGSLVLRYKAPGKRSEYTLRTIIVPVPPKPDTPKYTPPETISFQVESTLATNGLEAFVKQENINTKESRITPLGGQQLAVLKDYCAADLGFFSVPKDGKVVFVGETKRGDKDCYELEYTYAGGTKFRRWFDKKTFASVGQQIAGAENAAAEPVVMDEGEIVAAGIKFPKKNIHYRDGKKENTVEFTNVIINEEIPDSVFNFPMP